MYYNYCKTPELIENYELALKDNFKGWACHHRLETHNSDGERRLVDISKKELIALGIYYDRPPAELIFMKKGDHTSLHMKGHPATKGFSDQHHSNETKQKISESHKGKHHSEETRNKISEANKGKHKDKHWKLVDGKRVWY